MQAAVACLEEHGYAGLSISTVVQRAGVTRGALFHHFATRAELIAEAVWWHKRALWIQERGDLLAAVAAGKTLEEQVSLSWSHAQKRAAIDTEMMIAIRADEELHRAWEAVDARYQGIEPRFNTTPVAWATLAGDPTPELTRFLVGYLVAGMQVLAPFNDPELPGKALTKFARILELAAATMKHGRTGGDSE